MNTKKLSGATTALLTAMIFAANASAAGKTNTGQEQQSPDTTKPVKVYILAGQSNMVGMGEISGARCRYTGIYLTPDPAAPKGPLVIYRVGSYKIAPLYIYRSADPKASKGATAFIYKGAYDPAADYDKARPAKTQPIALGVANGTLPTIPGPHTCVVRGYVEVPQTGTYIVGPGHGDSACNVTVFDGR